MLTLEELEQVRDEVGDTPPDEDLEAIHSRVGSVGATIYSVLARRLANLMAAPSSFAIPGEYSQSTQANIQALQKQLTRWSAFAPVGPSVLGTLQLVSRHSRTRRRDSRQALDTEA